MKSVSRTASCQNFWVCRHWVDFVTGCRPARKAECDWVSWAALELKQLTSRRSHVMWARGVPLTIPLLPAFRAILTILRHNHSHFYNRQVYTSYCSREVNSTRMQMFVLHLSVLLGSPKSFSRSVPIFSDMFEKDLLIGICMYTGCLFCVKSKSIAKLGELDCPSFTWSSPRLIFKYLVILGWIS